MVPDNVEATMMALAASTINLSKGSLGEFVGAFINKNFVGVSSNNLSQYYKLSIISIFACFYEYLIIRLIPTMKEVQKEINEKVELRRESSMMVNEGKKK